MSQIEQIELSLEEAKNMVNARDEALKLTSNRAYKKLIHDGFLKDEAVRLTHLLADPSAQAHLDEIHKGLHAIAYFRQYMANVVRMGDIAEQEIQDYESELDLVREEENMVA